MLKKSGKANEKSFFHVSVAPTTETDSTTTETLKLCSTVPSSPLAMSDLSVTNSSSTTNDLYVLYQ
jgi:hypothetical protein